MDLSTDLNVPRFEPRTGNKNDVHVTVVYSYLTPDVRLDLVSNVITRKGGISESIWSGCVSEEESIEER